MTTRRKRSMQPPIYTLKQAYGEFMLDKTAMNCSKDTLYLYNIHISHFLDTHDLWNLPTRELAKSHYQHWIEHMQNEPTKKDVTISSYCRSVRGFIYWLQENEYTEKYPLKIPKYQKTIKICYTDEELARLLTKPRKCSEVQYQTWVFINLVCATGIRLSSALNLQVSDLQMDEKKIHVQKTKNNRAQVLFLNPDMSAILQKYISLFNLSGNDYLFCSAEKKQLNKRTIQGNVADYNRMHDVQKTSIHLFRHTFAKNYYTHTKDIYTLSHILGHSSISTTEHYLRDLGVDPGNATIYNPQALYGAEPKRRSRRIRSFPDKF